MTGESEPPDWVLAIASALGLLFAIPFAYFIVGYWLALVRLGGWFSYVIVGWAVLAGAFIAFHVIAPQVERWHHIRLGRKLIRENTSGRDS